MEFVPPDRVNLLSTGDRQTEVLLQLIDGSDDLIACATIDGRAMFVNRAGRELLGLEAERVPQTTISDYHPPEDMAYFYAEIMPALQRDGRWLGEFRFRHFQTGTFIPVDYHVFLIRDPQTGEPTHVATISRDRRERLKMDAERETIYAALRESERKFRAVFDQTFELMGLISLNGKVLDINQSALDAIAAQPQEIIGRMFWDTPWWTYSPEIPRRLREAISQAAQGSTIRYEVPFYDAEGQVRTADFSLKPAWDEEGRATLLIAEGRDLTEFKQKERLLQESEEQLRIGTRVAGVAIARFDYASDTVNLSPEAADLYGIPRAELEISRERIHATFHPDDRGWLAATISRVVDPDGEGWFASDHRVVWPNGEVRWLSVRKQVFFDRAGAVPRADYAILAAIDITERKQLEATIQSQLAQINTIYASAPIGLCFLDRQRRFVQLNERLAEINGLPISAHLGRTVREILPELAELQEPIFERVLTTGEAVLDIEVSGQTPAQPGVDRTWLVSYHPLRTGDSEPIGINIMVQEITERKRADAERERLRADAEAANRSKDEFVAMVAHELRSPLNSIAGWAKLLQERQLDPETTTKALDTIVRNTQAQVQLVEDLLDISRLVRGTLHLQLDRVDLATTIETAIDLVLPQAQAKHIQITGRFTQRPQVDGDVYRLQQIVVNLLNNAIKFTPAGGRVTIELESEDRACLRVSDTGVGIEAEFLPHIFERFHQGQANHDGKDGLGLGLAIVKNLVELHHGEIIATSPGVDLGATFTIYWPLAIAPTTTTPASSTPLTSSTLTGVRILVVDDETDMTDLVEFILLEAGAEVLTANSADAACDYWTEFAPDLLISDLAMPAASGYQLLDRVRSLPRGNIPAIALTAYASRTSEEQSRQAGFQIYLTKPVSPESLIAAISRLVVSG